METTISEKGWVVIPVELRRKYHLQPGMKVHFVDYAGVISIIPVRDQPIQEGRGMLAGNGRSLTKALLDDHDQEIRGEGR